MAAPDDDCGNENVSASTLVGGHRHFSLPQSSSASRFTAAAASSAYLTAQRPHCLAGHIRFELANPGPDQLIGFARQFGLG
jgi:hypothetical protein